MTIHDATHRRRYWGLAFCGFALAALAALAAILPPLAQPQSYHRFADGRSFLGLPNFLNVVSNLPFLLVGMQGLAILRRPAPGAFAASLERLPYAVFFLGLAATCGGSAWYHLAPDDAGLFWDRLPISLSFGALLAAVAAERVGIRAGLVLLAPLLAAGGGTVLYWRFSQAWGGENLWPYFAFQAGAIFGLVALMRVFPSRYTHGEKLAWAVLLYGLAVAAEQFDQFIFDLGRVVSGHTLKHLLAAAAVHQVVRMLRARSALSRLCRDRW